jgi:hypothetical protein
MTTRTDMPPALTAADERFLSELAQQLRRQHPVQHRSGVWASDLGHVGRDLMAAARPAAARRNG